MILTEDLETVSTGAHSQWLDLSHARREWGVISPVRFGVDASIDQARTRHRLQEWHQLRRHVVASSHQRSARGRAHPRHM